MLVAPLLALTLSGMSAHLALLSAQVDTLNRLPRDKQAAAIRKLDPMAPLRVKGCELDKPVLWRARVLGVDFEGRYGSARQTPVVELLLGPREPTAAPCLEHRLLVFMPWGGGKVTSALRRRGTAWLETGALFDARPFREGIWVSEPTPPGAPRSEAFYALWGTTLIERARVTRS